ncbi:DNA-binding LacI/PurR family transcriptional regulator [Alkalibacillus filiformis]|uniref:DNA-binding LacI/PurR family transcriptional regulator n=1 Tax=Alkalibacillus filiformis TaxID=200990 RepID=A0ABU0DUP1_9BACI|nr:LacI family DNA-binding transcriptional regulator [Alkalibacillus filiformis]MDQ0352177.1 DNA-binding LacI/PurR family transcriptional regulator [Alkalibacillus filiformis]
MTPTIKDVAKLANVSPSTVSRVIANNPRISEKTKVIVREAMQDLGYHPNYTARSLVSKSTETIGLIMPSSGNKVFQNPFFPEVIRGISTKSHENQYGIYMTTGNTKEEIYNGIYDMVQGHRLDGLILLYSEVNDQIMNYLLEQDFPFTVIGKPYENEELITYVDNNNVQASLEATNHLINLGHERIAFVGGGLDLVVTIDRLNGYERALEHANLEKCKDYVVHQEFLQEGGREAIKELMSLESPPTGLVVTDDVLAFGIVNTLEHMGLKVKQDISIVSFNNVIFSELSNPALTSVDINIFQLGYEAANSLFEQINSASHTPKKITVPHELVLRESCGEA